VAKETDAEKVTRFESALNQLIGRIAEDRYVLAVVLVGSLSEETIWDRESLGLWIIEADGRGVVHREWAEPDRSSWRVADGEADGVSSTRVDMSGLDRFPILVLRDGREVKHAAPTKVRPTTRSSRGRQRYRNCRQSLRQPSMHSRLLIHLRAGSRPTNANRSRSPKDNRLPN